MTANDNAKIGVPGKSQPLVVPSLSSMRGLKYLLLSAWITAVASLPAEGEGVTNGPQPFRLKFYDGEVNGAHRKRFYNETDLVEYCRLWAHSSE